MEASSNQQLQQKEKESRVHRPYAFDKMEGLVREMQDPQNGVPVRSQKQFLTLIPSAFMGECHRYLRCGINVSGHHGQESTVDCLRVAGYDLVEWLMDRLSIEESVEALHIANQLCQYGYFFPVNDSKTLTVKDDSSLYRFQSPYYWPWQHRNPDNVEYAIYLAKRTLRNKQRHALEDYETEALNSLRKNLQNKWDIIQLQAEEQAQVRLAKDRKKGDKIVSDSQERAFWRVYRPPPGCLSSLEVVPGPTRFRPGLPRPPPRKRTVAELQREVDFLRNSLTRTRIKVSAAIENLKSYFETYVEYDPMFVHPLPSNPWITDDSTFWQLNSPVVEVPTEKRVKRWELSMEELMSDPTGLLEFTNYLRKEYSHENIRFWLAVKDLRHSYQAQITEKVNDIFREFLAPGAPCEINIDGKTMEKVHQEMRNPSRFTFDSAAEHVYTLLLKKDCYPRFIRSDQYRNLLAAGVQPLQKKRFFSFGGQAKKKMASSASTTTSTLQQQQQQQHGGNLGSSGGGTGGSASSGVGGVGSGGSGAGGGRRRGSDRSLSGSAHELAVCGVREISSTPRVPHSHSQSNLTEIPYRDAGATEATVRPMDDVCPWDAIPGPSTEAGPDAAPFGTSPWPDTTQESWEYGNDVTKTSIHFIDVARPSRKNSSQLDSCSSSSDVSLAIAEVSDRLRKSCSLQHSAVPSARMERHGIGSGSGGHTITRNYSTGSTSNRVKLSDIGRPLATSCNLPSPRESFEYSHAAGEKFETIISEATIEEPETLIITTTTTTASLETTQQMDKVVTIEETKKGTRRLSTKAPLISISAIVGDLPSDSEGVGTTTGDVCTPSKETLMEIELEEEKERKEKEKDKQKETEKEEEGQTEKEKDKEEEEEEERGGGEGEGEEALLEKDDVEKVTKEVGAETQKDEPTEEAQVVPVWEPDTQQEDQTAPTTTATTTSTVPTRDKRDNNVNEVCPWEDEENCRVDTTYVKTYATLGYL
ncbi:uncharacterized protein LOC122526068 isoform X3 [Polistes fuscatus]|uniref:uncharacterized protein LOC122526068 isoform X3 n=1 Tax=Polistes fuscatus TaxID=30207 RepID=UPI001CA89E11|nr:uncharacterized protein LOC122526068 isoform X3 [Polistes fuscatus]